MFRRVLFTLLVAVFLVVPAWGQVMDGIDPGATAQTATNGDSYDPPTLFIDTLSLNGSYNGNPAARAFYALGDGTILQPGSFGVTGFSEPNSVAWNCNATTANGAVPALPELIAFTGGSVTRVSMTVGSASSAGQTATLVALSAGFGVLDFDTVTIAAAMQTLSTSAAGTAFVVVLGPCVLVMDDLTFL